MTLPTPEPITATATQTADDTGQLGGRPSGPAAAVLLSIGIGALAMAIVVGFADANKAFNDGFVHSVGKAWVPGAQGIGPYSGKFTFFFVGWLLSWAVGHVALKNKDVDLGKWAIVSFALISLGILLVWPPITHLVFVR
jgi:hypothetical protein